MNVLFVGAEAVPFAKKGGLADVMGSLPPELRRQGVDARVIMPYYRSINAQKYDIRWAFSFPFIRPTGVTEVQVFKATYNEVPFYFVRAWPFFGEESGNDVYTFPQWDVPRYVFFNQVTMAVAWELRGREDWFPDVFHVNDWHTGLLPFLLDLSRGSPNWAGVASVLSVHNAGEYYQAQGVGGWLWQLQIPPRTHPALVYYDLTDNMLAIGAAYADVIVPVSPRYGVEMHYAYMTGAMSGLVYARTADVHGIVNGIDTDYWNPEKDPLINPHFFNAENFAEQRPANKRLLQEQTGLAVRPDIPIVGAVTRLVQQKGFDLAVDPIYQLVAENRIQFALVGSGDPTLDKRFADLARAFPERVAIEPGYNEPLAHRVYAGCDIFLMPSHYEPCGIGQMNAMRYGALPLVRETGGLADTVPNYDGGAADAGKGFVFQWESPGAVYGTLDWAIKTYHGNPQAWQRMQKRGMETDFSWEKSAQEYISVYRTALIRQRGEGAV